MGTARPPTRRATAAARRPPLSPAARLSAAAAAASRAATAPSHLRAAMWVVRAARACGKGVILGGPPTRAPGRLSSNPLFFKPPPPQQVALKFEHKSSKGCVNGPPYEWLVYRSAPPPLNPSNLLFFVVLPPPPAAALPPSPRETHTARRAVLLLLTPACSLSLPSSTTHPPKHT